MVSINIKLWWKSKLMTKIHSSNLLNSPNQSHSDEIRVVENPECTYIHTYTYHQRPIFIARKKAHAMKKSLTS